MLAVVLLATGWATPLAVPHSWGDDPLCAVGSSHGEAAAWAGGVAVSTGAPEHCVVCHTARSFRSGPAATGRLVVATVPELILESPAGHLQHAPAPGPQPARAPPA